jgi:hypothetical protein
MNREQLQTILWLRWRLMRNQWARHGWLGAVLAVLAGFGALVTAAGGFIGALLGAAFKLGDAQPKVILLVWLAATVAFLFFWLLGLLAELQRSEMIDLPKLMHLPVALGQLFVVNYLVSHFTPSIIIMVPVMLGLATGLAIARGPEMVLLIPLALSMVLMITAWTYCLRGWLASLMSNPRRRRTVIMFISFSFIVLAQGPNLYFNVFGRHALTVGGNGNLPHSGGQAAAKYVKPSRGRCGLSSRRCGCRLAPRDWRRDAHCPRFYGTLGCLGLAALGLRQAYRSSFKFYQGETGGKPAARRKPAGTAANNGRGRKIAARPPGMAAARRARTVGGAGAGHLPLPAPGAGSENGAGNFNHFGAVRGGDGLSPVAAGPYRHGKTVHRHSGSHALDLYSESIFHQSVWF